MQDYGIGQCMRF